MPERARVAAAGARHGPYIDIGTTLDIGSRARARPCRTLLRRGVARRWRVGRRTGSTSWLIRRCRTQSANSPCWTYRGLGGGWTPSGAPGPPFRMSNPSA